MYVLHPLLQAAFERLDRLGMIAALDVGGLLLFHKPSGRLEVVCLPSIVRSWLYLELGCGDPVSSDAITYHLSGPCANPRPHQSALDYSNIYPFPKANLFQLLPSRRTPSSTSHPFTTQIFLTTASR